MGERSYHTTFPDRMPIWVATLLKELGVPKYILEPSLPASAKLT